MKMISLIFDTYFAEPKITKHLPAAVAMPDVASGDLNVIADYASFCYLALLLHSIYVYGHCD